MVLPPPFFFQGAAMLKKLFDTGNDRTLTFLRILGGIMMLPHGAQKMLGLFGGPGYAASMGMFGQMGIPAPLAVLAIYTEFFGCLLLIAGFLGRLASLGLIIEMVVAVVMVHLPFGFFMNWAGTQPGEGFEYHILYMALLAPVMVKGAGAWSVDRRIAHWLESHRPTEHHVDRLRHAHVH
jgi:putative oxidoreductase